MPVQRPAALLLLWTVGLVWGSGRHPTPFTPLQDLRGVDLATEDRPRNDDVEDLLAYDGFLPAGLLGEPSRGEGPQQEPILEGEVAHSSPERINRGVNVLGSLGGGAKSVSYRTHQNIQHGGQPITLLEPRQRTRRSLERTNDRSPEPAKEYRVLDLDESGLMELTNTTLRVPFGPGILLRLTAAPHHGRILLRGEPARQFTAADLAAQVLVYEHDGAETGRTVLQDRFVFAAGEHDVEVEVNIHPIDDTAPELRLEGKLRVKEGGRGKLSTRQVTVEDPDTADGDITCHVIAQPMFGQLRVADRLSSKFDYAQLKNGLVWYVQSVHLGMEPREDGLSIACYDLENNTQSGNNFGIINISIDSVDDEPPTISPKILSVAKGGEVPLSKEVIFPNDIDTPLEKLTFAIDVLPTKGVVMRKVGFSEYHGVKNFSFNEMKEVYYRSGAERGEDTFTLKISDGVHESTGKVRVSIQKEETTPQLLINEGLELDEGSTVLITQKILFAEDGDTPPEDIAYVLRDAPLFGSLLLRGAELVPGSRFTQSSVSQSFLAYRHLDSSSTMDVFVFDLTDGKNTLFNQNFFITIHSRNQSYPVVTSDTAVMQPLSTLVITPNILRVKNPEDVEFHVMAPPRQGRLERRGKPEALHTFTYTDVEERLIQYVHVTNKSVPEIIQFEVSDGHSSVFHTFNINFTNDNSQFLMSAEALVSEELTEETVTSKPVVLVNSPIRSLRKLEDGRLGAPITRRNLYAEDDGRNVTYVIADPPKYGNLFNQRTNNTCGNFTQDDVNSGRLLYILKPEVKVPGDAVLLNVLGQGLPLKGLEFILEWSYVQFKSNISFVMEVDVLLKVPLLRWGSLTESAFVGITVAGGNGTFNEDFTVMEEQVQFSPGQNVAFLNLKVLDDSFFEGPETVVLSLVDPYSLLIDDPASTVVLIDDIEDEPKYFFTNQKYHVYENTSEIIFPIQRLGDTSREAVLECITENGEAEGGTKLDFLPQPGIPAIAKFGSGDSKSFCSVTLYDDDIMEPEEDFWVHLKSGKIVLSDTHVTILPDDKDCPSVSFQSEEISVLENVGRITVEVIVDGPREIVNASVTVVATSISAKANKDFIFHKTEVIITPDQNKYDVFVDVIDDNKAKMYEGNETFLLTLVEPKNCKLGAKGSMTINIEDEADVPVLQFTRTNYTVREIVGEMDLEIERAGDMMGSYNVICFIHEGSATDFSFLHNGTFQVVTFFPGEMKKNCTIAVHDDNIYESNEYFSVHLKPEDKNIKIGERSQVKIIITDEEDREIVFFRKTHYFTKEPQSAGQNGSVKVHVSREGDSKHATDVRVYTRDGTARSGEDYIGKSTVMRLEPGQKTFTCDVQVLFDKVTEIKEYFTIHLEVLNNGDTIYARKAIIYIYDSPQPGGVMFPAPPLIHSPNSFEEAAGSERNFVIQGAPLVCITVCNKDHHLAKKFEHWCKKHEVSDDNTKYSWQIEDRYGRPVDIPYPAFFANGSTPLLESVYVRGGGRLRCGVAPSWGPTTGKTSYSETVAVSRSPGACPPPSQSMMGAEPFIAQISYSEGGREKVKLIKVSVAIPHYDAMFPAISTHPLGDAFQILSSYTPRSEIHKCSNIITREELQTKFGFLGNDNNSQLITFPVELQSSRGEDAVNLYRHLDLKACVWTFEAYYTLDEAVNFCGATINSESNVYDADRTSVTLELPLYVSYYTYSIYGWQHTDTSIVLRLTFLYEGSVLSDEGVVRQEEEPLEGVLHPTSMHISNNGSLVVFFRTTPKFPGHFLLRTDDGFQSFVQSLEHPEIPITLKLMNNRTHTPEEEQYWVFHSEFSNDDYTGRYEVSMVPCVFVDSMDVCTPRPNIIFPLDIHLQQISDPVLKKYTLNTSFHIIKKRDAANSIEESSMFEPGDQVYGFIDMEPPQSHLELVIDQCYVCSGRNGRTPRYNPKKKEYGCLMESPDLQYSVKIIDRHTPGSTQKSFHDMNFNASLIQKNENNTVTSQLQAKNVDIFHFDITPLFSLRSAKVWFVHCTFTIRSAGPGRLAKRSLNEERRSKAPLRRGTNMHRLLLQGQQQQQQQRAGQQQTGGQQSGGALVDRLRAGPTTPVDRLQSGLAIPTDHLHLLWLGSVLLVLLLSLVLTLVLLCYILHVKRELADKKKTTYTNVNYRECHTNDCNY